jgi:hypothetical protein
VALHACWWVALASLALGTGCRGRNLASAMAGGPTVEGQARCGVVKSHARPLIIEWPSADRAALEGLVEKNNGLVAVRYAGCEMEIVRRCVVAGRYGFTAVEPKRDDQEFRSADELYAKIPLGAAQLESQLERHGALTLEMTVVGHYETGRERVARSELRGDCEAATHVISAVTVGAFKLSSGSGAKIRGGVGVVGFGGGAGSSASAARSAATATRRAVTAAARRLHRRAAAPCCASRSSRSARPTSWRRCASAGRVRVARCSSRAGGSGRASRASGWSRWTTSASTATRSACPTMPAAPTTGRARPRRRRCRARG